MPSKYIDLTGQRFGRLTVLSLSPTRPGHWLCLCDCGNHHTAGKYNLEHKLIRSCKCLQQESRQTHQKSKTKIYAIWREMVSRCTNPDNQNWHKYGARGIAVRERWRTFENFYSDMGDRPEGLSLERINNDGNYEPDNCRWATPYDQARNTRRNLWWTYKGETKCAEDWAKEYGIKSNVLRNRIALGWSMEEALTKPVEPRRPRKQ